MKEIKDYRVSYVPYLFKGISTLYDILDTRVVFIDVDNNVEEKTLSQVFIESNSILREVVIKTDDDTLPVLTPFENEEDLKNYQFATPRTNYYKGNMQLTFIFSYGWKEADEVIMKDYELNISLPIDGYIGLSATPRSYYIREGAILNTEMFDINIIDANNKSLDWNSPIKRMNYTLTALNKSTQLTYNENDILNSGVYEIQLKINEPYAQVESKTNFNVFSKTNSKLVIDTIKNKYNVGEKIENRDINVYISYYIDENNRRDILSTNFTIEPRNINIGDIGEKTITVKDLDTNLTATYQIFVYGVVRNALYVYDKETKLGHDFGEIEENYNMSFTLDGTKDSCKVIVRNFENDTIKPFTIAHIISNDTWWYVSKDTCKKYTNENGEGLWEHQIELLGAFDLLNYRDMPSLGFNKNRYTLNEMLERIIKNSTWEYKTEFSLQGTARDINIEYVKVFEDYTPATAIREILNGMNSVPKMYFSVDIDNRITKCVIYSLLKSGDKNQDILEDTIFNEANETKNANKNNYGTQVVSNVRNCISTSVLRFPNVGATKLTSNEYKINGDNANIILPTNVEKVLSIGICPSFSLNYRRSGGAFADFEVKSSSHCFDDYNSGKLVDKIIDKYKNEPDYNQIKEELTANKKDIINSIRDNLYILLKEGDSLHIDHRWLVFTPISGALKEDVDLVLTDKLHYELAEKKFNNIYWEQGKNTINNFKYTDQIIPSRELSANYKIKELLSNRSNVDENGLLIYKGSIEIYATVMSFSSTDIEEVHYFVNYIPQSDLKIKVNNKLNQRDSVLYNQTGKLVDSYAVSKLITSYADSISSNEITRYGVFRNFYEVPKVGSIVNVGNEEYIINSVSIDNYTLEANSNYLDCQFTLTKNVACKSILISANNNIRDYDIPQSRNVKRIQVYRDYFELSYDTIHNEESYLPYLETIFYFERNEKGHNQDQNAYIKITTDRDRYYQLPCYTTLLDKMTISTCDFKDNNIIGFARTSYTQLDLDLFNLFQKTSLINVPINYVSKYGEVGGIEIELVNVEYLNYIQANYFYGKEDATKQSSKFFTTPILDKNVYDLSKEYEQDMVVIKEPSYNKDAFEVPCFEHIIQVGDNEDIVFGSTFLKYLKSIKNNKFLEYTFKIYENYIYNDSSVYTKVKDEYEIVGEEYTVKNKAEIKVLGNDLVIKLFSQAIININTGNSIVREVFANSIKGKNIAFFVNEVGNKVYDYPNDNKKLLYNKTKELLFAINNCKIDLDNEGSITLHINNWKMR